MLKVYLIAILASAGASAYAQETKATPESIEACKAVGTNFTDIAKCVPDMDPALAALTAFSEIYNESAEPLKSKCLELNDSQIGAYICVRKAIEEAVSLREMLPDGEEIDDPVFTAVSSRESLARLVRVYDEAASKFPPNSGFGFSTYHPYQ